MSECVGERAGGTATKKKKPRKNQCITGTSRQAGLFLIMITKQEKSKQWMAICAFDMHL